MAKFRKALKGKETQFFDKVAKVVFADRKVKAFVSKYETVEWKGIIFRPNIDRPSRFSQLLQGIHKKNPGLVENAVTKTVHDKLNRTMVEVRNAKGDTWRLSGDGTLNRKSLEIGRKAVAQSQVNILNAMGKKGSLNYTTLFKNVWDYVPRPTTRGIKVIQDQIKALADPSKKATIDEVAEMIKTNIKTIISELVKRKILKKA